jgi:phosphopantetheinyl transferase
MPLVLLEEINEDVCWGLWNIHENTEDLIRQMDVSDEELGFLDNIHHPTKRNESLAARLVLKSILEKWGHTYPGIWKDEYDKPHLRDLPFQISLSHAKDYGVAILHKTKSVGIDMELIRDKLFRIERKFLSSEELKNTDKNLDKMTILWAGKEAIYKLYGKKKLIFNQDIQSDSFELKEKGQIEAYLKPDTPDEQVYQLSYLKYKDYSVAYVF